MKKHISRWYSSLDDEAKYRFDERAGIREYDGGMDRPHAEEMTFEEKEKKPADASPAATTVGCNECRRPNKK